MGGSLEDRAHRLEEIALIGKCINEFLKRKFFFLLTHMIININPLVINKIDHAFRSNL